jgi:hypothetical protein
LIKEEKRGKGVASPASSSEDEEDDVTDTDGEDSSDNSDDDQTFGHEEDSPKVDIMG